MKTNLFLLCILLTPLVCHADFWETPKEKAYYSEDSSYCLVITPGEDGLFKQQSTNAKKEKQDNYIKTGTPCIAKYYKIEEGDSILIWEHELANKIAPLVVIISESGTIIATFNNWFENMANDNTTMVIYNNQGAILEKYSLMDISPIDVSTFRMSISSIHWLKNAYFKSDSDTIVIEFVNDSGFIFVRHYNCKKQSFED